MNELFYGFQKIFYDDFLLIEALYWILAPTKGMFTGGNMVRMFVIPDVCGPAGQRYFLGKHE